LVTDFGVESCCCHGQLTSFPLVTISTAVGRLSRRLQFRALCCQLTSKADKLPMDTEPVARDSGTIFALKLGDWTFVRLTQLIIVVTRRSQ